MGLHSMAAVCLLCAKWHPCMAGVFLFYVALPSIPAMHALLAERFPPAELGRISAMATTASALGAAISTPILAWIFDARARGARAALPFAIGALVVAFGAAMLGMALRMAELEVRRRRTSAPLADHTPEII